jgi:predicted outer membrane lipoprotein
MFFQNRPELLFTAASMLIAFIGGSFILENWVIGFVIAAFFGVLNGAGLWLLYRRNRLSRAATIRQVRMMLCDVVNNKLAVISLASRMSTTANAEETSQRLRLIDESVKDISECISNLSEESLDRWHAKYAAAECERATCITPRLKKRRRRLTGASQSRPPRAQP